MSFFFHSSMIDKGNQEPVHMSIGCTTSSKTSTPTVTVVSCGILTEMREDGMVGEFRTPKVEEDRGIEDL
jgi:hypothetical protein